MFQGVPISLRYVIALRNALIDSRRFAVLRTLRTPIELFTFNRLDQLKTDMAKPRVSRSKP